MSDGFYDAPYAEQHVPTKPKKPKVPGIVKLIVAVIIATLAVILAFASFRAIPEGHIGVKYQLGKIVETGIPAGPSWHLPVLQSIEIVDTREQVYESTTSAYTKDTQTVEAVVLTLNYSYVSSELPNIIRNIGVSNIESKLIVPQVNSVLKNAIGKYKAEELVQNRTDLQERVEEELRESLTAAGINVHAFNIKDIDFEDSFEDVIRAKVAAEQEALRKQNETVAKQEEAKQLLIAAEAEADAKKMEADAEAYAIQVVQEQLKSSPEYNELQMIQRWDGHWPQVMGNTVNPFVTIGGTESSAPTAAPQD